MDHIDKIKALQQKAGIEADGVISSKTWLNIHFLLFGSLPYDINISSIIKSIQKKINVRADGYPWHKTWTILYEVLILNENKVYADDLIDAQHDVVLKNLPKEVVPFAKELIFLTATEGINIRIKNAVIDNKILQNFDPLLADTEISFLTKGFGLAFDVEILERNEVGEFSPLTVSPLYKKVAKLGESIGLTWAGDIERKYKNPNFILRPAWAVRMKEDEMIKELSRRQKENINLLAIL